MGNQQITGWRNRQAVASKTALPRPPTRKAAERDNTNSPFCTPIPKAGDTNTRRATGMFASV